MIRRATSNNVEGRLNISNVGPRFGLAKLTASGIRGALILVALSALLLFAARPMQGQTETVLYSFGSQSGDGINPYYYESLIFDKQGNLYGTTEIGGAFGYGTVFMLTPTGTETVLYSFGSQLGDGLYPLTGLARDNKGNLYGTTYAGGSIVGGSGGGGTAFKLTLSGTETVLYSFGSQLGDGLFPESGLVFDRQGNLYGSTLFSTVFKLTPTGTETVLYSFGQSGDGASPYGGLVFDKQGNLYGTTSQGGLYAFGTLFKLTPTGTETVLHSFQSVDGAFPYGGLVFDKQGDLYGTTYLGGNGYGTVFKLSPAGTLTTLYRFGSQLGDGSWPTTGLVLDKNGNLYGATSGGGVYRGGTVFKLTPTGT
jgi:uncharacterized repeat protein (TIGR03803 family)